MGKKNISDLYVNPSITYEFKDIRPIFETKTVQIDGESVDIHKCEVSDEYKVTKRCAGLKRLLKN